MNYRLWMTTVWSVIAICFAILLYKALIFLN